MCHIQRLDTKRNPNAGGKRASICLSPNVNVAPQHFYNVTRVDACARACTSNNVESLNVFPVKVASRGWTVLA